MSNITNQLLSVGNAISVTGQALLSAKGEYTWTVPEDVHSICVVAVGSGMKGGSGGNGSGGGLSWRNNIPVTPGEKLTVRMGDYYTRQYNYHHTTLLRGNQILVIAHHGDSGLGGKAANPINDGGGNGGKMGPQGGGGGAGGYMGNGGDGGNIGAAGQGGGGSGGGDYYSNNLIAGYGGGVGLLGMGESGAARGGSGASRTGNPGSGGTGSTFGGGGSRYNSGGGTRIGGSPGMRIIWGTGRFFPNTNTHNM